MRPNKTQTQFVSAHWRLCLWAWTSSAAPGSVVTEFPECNLSISPSRCRTPMAFSFQSATFTKVFPKWDRNHVTSPLRGLTGVQGMLLKPTTVPRNLSDAFPIQFPLFPLYHDTTMHLAIINAGSHAAYSLSFTRCSETLALFYRWGHWRFTLQVTIAGCTHEQVAPRICPTLFPLILSRHAFPRTVLSARTMSTECSPQSVCVNQ